MPSFGQALWKLQKLIFALQLLTQCAGAWKNRTFTSSASASDPPSPLRHLSCDPPLHHSPIWNSVTTLALLYLLPPLSPVSNFSLQKPEWAFKNIFCPLRPLTPLNFPFGIDFQLLALMCKTPCLPWPPTTIIQLQPPWRRFCSLDSPGLFCRP